MPLEMPGYWGFLHEWQWQTRHSGSPARYPGSSQVTAMSSRGQLSLALKPRRTKDRFHLSLGSDGLKHLVQRLTSPDLGQPTAGKPLIFLLHLLFSVLHHPMVTCWTRNRSSHPLGVRTSPLGAGPFPWVYNKELVWDLYTTVCTS